jgi:hypothetical protein
MVNAGFLNANGRLQAPKMPDLNSLSSRHCKECGGSIFIETKEHYDWPGLINPSGQDITITVGKFRCLQCGAVVGGPGDMVLMTPAQRREIELKRLEAKQDGV